MPDKSLTSNNAEIVEEITVEEVTVDKITEEEITVEIQKTPKKKTVQLSDVLDRKGRPWPQHLVDEWDEKKNGPITDYTLGSGIPVDWICRKGACGTVHEWQAVIYSRTGKNHRGCPICANQKMCPDKCNSLWALRPDLREEWHPTKNNKTMKEHSVGSGKKVWWKHQGKCGTDHEWQASISSRTSKKPTGCPICANKQICPDKCNSLWALRPDLRDEWHPTKNDKTMKEYSVGSGKKVWWKHQGKCGKEHEWQAAICDRTGKQNGCPICANKQICPDYCNSLQKLKPDLQSEWHPTKNNKTMKEYSVGSSKKVWWQHQGKCGTVHEWQAAISHRTSKKPRGCPICANKQICPCPDACNSLWALRLDLRKEWHPTKNDKTMEEYSVGSGEKVWWKHQGKCGTVHEWQAAISHRTSKKPTGCPICANRQICPDKCNSLFALRPDLREEWHPTKNEKTMEEYSVASHKKVWWICTAKGHEYPATISNRTNGRGCPKCQNKTQTKLYKWLKEMYGHLTKVKGESDYNWCKKQRKLPFDIELLKWEFLCELDGIHHFQDVEFWKSFVDERRDVDIFKMQKALANGKSMMRLPCDIVREDVDPKWQWDWKAFVQKCVQLQRTNYYNRPVIYLPIQEKQIYSQHVKSLANHVVYI